MFIIVTWAEIIFVFVLFFVAASATAEALAGMVGVLTVVFIIKNLIQTVGVGCLKNQNSIAETILYVVTDFLRVKIFFDNLGKLAGIFSDAHGLNYFLAMFSFLLYAVICGGIFLAGEVLSLSQGMGKKMKSNDMGWLAPASAVAMVAMLAFVTWIGYQ